MKKKIELTDAEATLLLKVLKESVEFRSDMGCNDPDEDEENLFSKKERMKMRKFTDEYSEEDIEVSFMFNFEYPAYLRKLIKEQVK